MQKNNHIMEVLPKILNNIFYKINKMNIYIITILIVVIQMLCKIHKFLLNIALITMLMVKKYMDKLKILILEILIIKI